MFTGDHCYSTPCTKDVASTADNSSVIYTAELYVDKSMSETPQTPSIANETDLGIVEFGYILSTLYLIKDLLDTLKLF